ncbi:MAG: IS30 family transposase [Collinsella sp.]|nr:IS30 family transposase [Collinsella sp.]
MWKHLSHEERYLISKLCSCGYSMRRIARILSRAPSTISREIRKGKCSQIEGGALLTRYEPGHAEVVTARRAAAKGAPVKIGRDHATAQALERYLSEKRYSPYAALAAARAAGELHTRICCNTLYSYIRKGVLDVDEKRVLRRYRKQGVMHGSDRRRAKTGGKSIDERPPNVSSRHEFGHWEGDLVVSPRGSSRAVLTLLERKTRMLFAVLIENKSQAAVNSGLNLIERALGRTFPLIFKSITFDNGSEFLDASTMSESVFGSGRRIGEIYYAHPYRSSERGSNENANRLLRRAFPKGTPFDRVSQRDLLHHVAWVNAYPRRILKGKCANELYAEEVKKLLAAS